MNCTPGVFRLLDVLVEFGGDALGRPLTEYSCPAQHIRDRRVPIRLGGSRQRNRTRVRAVHQRQHIPVEPANAPPANASG